MPLPVGSNLNPILQLAQWITDPLGVMDSNAAQFGDIFTLRWAGLKNIVMVSEPNALQVVLTSPSFTAPGEANEIARPLVGDRSVILMSGEQHQQRRKLLMPPFHGDRLVSYGHIISKISNQVIDQIGLNQAFNVRAIMQDITLRVILQVVFGLYEGERLELLKQRLVTRLDVSSTKLGAMFIFLPFLRQDLGAWSPWGRVMKMQKDCDELIYAEIQERRANPDPERIDILNLLLATQDEDGNYLGDVDLRDELMTLLFAGHETTATALAWALYWVHKLPDVYQRLMSELQSLGDRPDPMAIFKAPYLTAVCNETLRIYPVAMTTFSRLVKTPVEISGQMLDAGTEVLASIYLTHRRTDLYPEPEKFRPERFLERQFSPYEFIPFGGGSRRCLGMALAQFEMKIILATILTNARLSLSNPSQNLSPVRRGALLAPEANFTMLKS
ncbi:cytochrome P450 [Pseudanabaena yagii]|uniref:Cytochrome P450 n=1 Tax=Pseudanabaena yagii GIHE-NHR1 TaxID=2722753 RepID=A0ABX1LX11_9CYAN|nr:cytochrome P450 [Pseudanabaena yagii]NMF60737.1 cytochrome P450 [Pseudanabaena yagii GIHE-NHR1]